MKALVIYNPVAGGGREALLARLIEALEARHVKVTLYRTCGPGDATRWLEKRGVSEDLVVAVGGDGTTNEVINGLPAGVPLALFATGTANVLAEELALPRRPEQAAAVIAAGEEIGIWPGRLNGRRFIMMCGIGYDAWVVHDVNVALKRLVGKGAYALSMMRMVRHYGRRQYQLELDGKHHTCFSAVVTNGQRYGGRFLMARNARVTEPRLQVLLFQAPGVMFLLRALLALLFGRMESVPGVISLPASRVRLLAPAGEVVQADGDPAGVLPAEIAVDPAPVTVRVSRQTRSRLGKPGISP